MANTAPRKGKLLINSGRSGVVYDEAGHSLGGGERLPVDDLDKVGEAAVARRYLFLLTVPAAVKAPAGQA